MKSRWKFRAEWRPKWSRLCGKQVFCHTATLLLWNTVKIIFLTGNAVEITLMLYEHTRPVYTPYNKSCSSAVILRWQKRTLPSGVRACNYHNDLVVWSWPPITKGMHVDTKKFAKCVEGRNRDWMSLSRSTRIGEASRPPIFLFLVLIYVSLTPLYASHAGKICASFLAVKQ